MGIITSPPIIQQLEAARLARLAIEQRANVEREVGRRSFSAFFRMAWPQIDPARLGWNWHIDLVTAELQAAARREQREMVICIPPRSLKSQIVGVSFAAWVFTWNAAAKFITCSNESQLATRDSVACRRLITSKWYQDRWGPPGLAAEHAQAAMLGKPAPVFEAVEIRHDQQEKTYWETTAGGHRFCATPGSNVTGHGADYIIGDDLHPAQKAESEADRARVLTWWFEAIPSRLNEPNRGVKIVIMQRLHDKDLAGECIRRGYYPVCLPAEYEPDHPQRHPKDPRTVPGQLLHPERINAETLGRLKRALGPYASAGQLQQRPVPREGGMFRREWFQIIDAVPASARASTVRRWDLAATMAQPGTDPDWTAGCKMSCDTEGRYYIEDMRRFRERPAVVDAAIKATATQDGSLVRIGVPEDPGQAGKAQASGLIRMLAGYHVSAIRETGAKEHRARPFSSQAEVGNVYLVRGRWNDDFLDEIGNFPLASHDDQVDAAVGAFTMLVGGNTGMLDFARAEAALNEPPVQQATTVTERVTFGWPMSE